MPASELSAEEIDNEPSATAAEWLEVGPGDLSPDGFEPRIDPATIPDHDLLACLGTPDPEPEAEL